VASGLARQGYAWQHRTHGGRRRRHGRPVSILWCRWLARGSWYWGTAGCSNPFCRLEGPKVPAK